MVRRLVCILITAFFSTSVFSLAVPDSSGSGYSNTPQDSLYTVLWYEFQNVNYTSDIYTLEKTTQEGWEQAGAYSTNTLEANKDGYVIYQVSSFQDEKVIGLSSRTNIQNHKNGDYGYLMEGNQLSIIESGTVVQSVNGILQSNTELKIARESNKILYYKNDLLIREVTTNPSYELYVETAIKNSGGEIKDPRTTFKPRIRVEITEIFHANCLTKELGGAIIRAYGAIYYATAMLTNIETGQQWNLSPSGESDNYVQFVASLLYPGKYEVLVTTADGSTGTQRFTVRSIVSWQEQENTLNDYYGMKKKGADGWGNSGVESATMLASSQDGKISYVVGAFDGEKSIGLTDAQQTDNLKHYNNIDYSFFITENGVAMIEQGSVVGYSPNIKKGDVLQIERRGDQIIYKKNEIALREKTVNPSQELKIRGSIYRDNSILRPILVNDCFESSPSDGDYFSIGSGNWNDPSNWSTEGYTSTVNTGSYPMSSDVAYIRNHIISVSGNESAQVVNIDNPKLFTTNLTVNNGAKLTVDRTFSVTSGAIEERTQYGPGSGDKKTSVIIEGTGELIVNGKMILNKLSGRENIELLLKDSAKLIVNEGLSLVYQDGDGGILVNMTGTSEINTPILDVTYKSGADKIEIVTNQVSKLTVLDGLLFNVAEGQKAGIVMKGNSTLILGGSVQRNTGFGYINSDLLATSTSFLMG